MQQPNILVIMTDQQRGDCLGVDGHPCLLTPNMDALAAAGVRFRHAYTTCPICVPARRSFLSGLHPQTHGLTGNDSDEWAPPATLPGMLRDAGYQTGWIGRSMHQYPPRKRFGYEEMVIPGGTKGEGDYEEYLRERLPEGGGYYGSGVMHNDWTARSWHLPEHLHQTHWTVNEALRFLKRRDPSRPFFLTVSFIAPHPPLVPPDFYFQRYLRTSLPEPLVGDWAEKPEFRGGAPRVSSAEVNLEGETLRSCRAAYYGLINHIDDQIRRLLSPVTGFDAKNTLVVFVSDHGEMLGDHYLFQKSKPYEGSARIPFIMAPPGSWREGAFGVVSDLPVCLEDIMPTLLEAAGVEPPDHLDGRSLLPVLKGEGNASWRDYLHIENGINRAYHALTDGKEKYIWFSRDGREQFFDLENDPGELRDLVLTDEGVQRLAPWRRRLMERLANRAEGFVEGDHLVAGRQHRKWVGG